MDKKLFYILPSPCTAIDNWQIDFTPQAIDLTTAQEKVRSAIIDSIQHHFVGDVPVGLFLSGGIDSTVILALPQQTQSEPLRTFSIAFAESEWADCLTQMPQKQTGRRKE